MRSKYVCAANSAWLAANDASIRAGNLKPVEVTRIRVLLPQAPLSPCV